MQRTDHYRLLEYVQPGPDPGPRVAEDVLVERFAAANAEHEPPPALDGGGRSGLGDDSGMDPHRRTDHRGGHV